VSCVFCFLILQGVETPELLLKACCMVSHPAAQTAWRLLICGR
jgi:hypothetical protein